MSIKWMAFVWDHGPSDRAERFVLLALADFANDDGECWPSVDGIARKTCMTERGCQKIIRRLEDTGWIVVDAGLGRRNCNIYKLKNPEPRSPRTTFTPNADAKKGERRSEKGERRSENPEPRSPEPSLTIIEPSENRQYARDGFADFWNEVPKKVGKGQAEKAYRAALKKTDHETIIAGIRRYAKERAGKDAQYTAHPATWLNGERWADEPAKRPASFHDTFEEAFNATHLRVADSDDCTRTEQLPAPVQDAGTPGRRGGSPEDSDDSGRYQQEVARILGRF